MPKYFIYSITYNNEPEFFYIGSTNNFSARKHKHKKNTTNKRGKLYWIKLYTFIRSKGGWDNFTIKIISEHELENKIDIRKIEQEIINDKKPFLNTKNSYKE
jgi:hypothetical protein